MKIGVLFNCQSTELAESMRLLRPDDEILHFTIPTLIKSRQARANAAEVLQSCDAAVVSDTHYALGPVAPERLRATGLRMVTVPPVIFSGFHPDICYPGSPDEADVKGRFESPTGLLHSRIAIASFLGGLTPPEAVLLYNRLTFRRLGYLARYAEEHALLLERYCNVAGIDLAPSFANWAKTGCFMHSDNHPKAIVLYDVARIACGLLGLRCAEAAPDGPLRDRLAHLPRHALYADIAEHLGVDAVPHFQLSNRAGGAPLQIDLPEYLARSFIAYENVPTAALMAIGGMAGTLRALGLSVTGA